MNKVAKRLGEYDEIKVIFEFQKESITTIIDQILKSPEITAQTNKINIDDKKKYQSEINKLAEKAFQKELEYYTKQYKVKTPEEYSKMVEELSKEDISDIRKQSCHQVINKGSS